MAKDFKESHKESAYASMEKDQLISMIHFLVKREDERAQENQELKDMGPGEPGTEGYGEGVEGYPQAGCEDADKPAEVYR